MSNSKECNIVEIFAYGDTASDFLPNNVLRQIRGRGPPKMSDSTLHCR